MQGGVGVATALTQISGYAHVAERYGFEEAVFLDSIVYWYRTNRANNRNFRDGRWWTYNSIKAFEEIFPWWSAKQIRRIANSCRDQGALIAGEYNEDRRDRSLWYTPGDELLALYGLAAQTGKCTCPNGQMQAPKGADECAQMGKCIYGIPCINHECTYMTPYSPPSQPEADGTVVGQSPMTSPDSPADFPGDGSVPEPGLTGQPAPKTRRTRREKSAPDHDPEAFEAFWSAYPRKDNRKKSIEAWDKLKPDKRLCRIMYDALKRQCCNPQWAEEGGKYIPMFSTWLNQRRWENQGVDLSLLQATQPQRSSGRVKDLEVL